MKNKTLLKVLSASAIFTAIAAIESYDHNAFATEVAATANNTQSNVETKTVPQDVKNLPDGTYNITSKALMFYGNARAESMASKGLDKNNTKLIVKNGQYSVNVNFKPISLYSLNGYLGDLKYYDGNKTHSNRYDIQDNEFKNTTIVNNYSEKENDTYTDIYKKKFPGRTVYPKTLSYSVDKNKIDANNKLETFTQVFVPVMEHITPGTGTQRMILEFDLSSLTKKTITVPKVDTEKLAKEKAEKERIEKERLAKEKAEKERIEREKAPVTAKGEPAISEKSEFDLEGYLKNHNGPITAKGEAAILDKPEFDLDAYIREQKGFVGEATPASDKKPLINDIFGQSEVKDTFVATPVSTKVSNATTANVKKSLANTGITNTTTAFLGLASLLAAFVIRRKFNK